MIFYYSIGSILSAQRFIKSKCPKAFLSSQIPSSHMILNEQQFKKNTEKTELKLQ
jgi:hypothetical protein